MYNTIYSQGFIYELRKSGLLSHLFIQYPSEGEKEQEEKNRQGWEF